MTGDKYEGDFVESCDLMNGPPVTLTVADVVMPGMNGFQATRRLTRDPKTADIPVIMITSKDQETDKIWGMRQGAVEYLVKPVAEKDLVAMIDSVMAD